MPTAGLVPVLVERESSAEDDGQWASQSNTSAEGDPDARMRDQSNALLVVVVLTLVVVVLRVSGG